MADTPNPRRTFAIISHPDAGKTTLTEKLLLFGGAIHLAGEVRARGNNRRARSDWMKIEQQRGISVTSSVMTFERAGVTFDLAHQRQPNAVAPPVRTHPEALYFREMTVWFTDRTKADAAHQLALMARDEEEPLGRTQLFEVEVTVVAVAAVALLKLVARRVDNGERAARVVDNDSDAESEPAFSGLAALLTPVIEMLAPALAAGADDPSPDTDRN